jgi:tRNA A37 threonylcarbamoyltransferase TsaD
VLLSGGVAASGYLRELLKEDSNLYFGLPELSSDNAAGTAILGMERVLRP